MEEENKPGKEEYITKKIAAIEVHRQLKKSKVLALGGIFASAICTAISTLSYYAGVVAAVIVTIGFGYIISNQTKEQKRLEEKYNFDE